MSHNNNIENYMTERYGYPLYVYKETDIDNQINILKEALPDFEIFYSVKANPNSFICQFIKSKGLGVDTASANEVLKAVDLEFSPNKIIYSSPGKTEEDIIRTMDKCTIIADSYNELIKINEIGKTRNEKIEVGLRINPYYSIGANNALEIMGGTSSKFGVDEETLIDNKNFINELKNIDITGIHVYIGSQILDYKTIYNNFKHIFRVAEFCITEMEWNISFIDFGGGFGIPYLPHEKPLDLEVLKHMLSKLVYEQKVVKKEKVRFIVESGRFIVTNSGCFLTKIVDIKISRGKKFLIVQGGMNGFFRPVFLNLLHPITLPLKQKDCKKEVVSVVGNLCTPIDILAEDILLPKAEIGDILCIDKAGSYGYSMSLKEFISHNQSKEIYITREGQFMTEGEVEYDT